MLGSTEGATAPNRLQFPYNDVVFPLLPGKVPKEQGLCKVEGYLLTRHVTNGEMAFTYFIQHKDQVATRRLTSMGSQFVHCLLQTVLGSLGLSCVEPLCQALYMLWSQKMRASQHGLVEESKS